MLGPLAGVRCPMPTERGGRTIGPLQVVCVGAVRSAVCEADSTVAEIMELIAEAPWREAVTYRDTWPHEYVVVKKDCQEKLLAAFCERIGRGEGVECRFFHQSRR